MTIDRNRPWVTKVTPAGPDHQVVSLAGAPTEYRRRPCSECPWRQANAGSFPPAAFLASAETSYDQSFEAFACHKSGVAKPSICAGFLLQGAAHNIGVRFSYYRGAIDPSQINRSDVPALFENYRAMAVANGVSPDDPALEACRDDTQMAAFD